ncbi:unnamed protein product [Caenorhabditis nigoni]
MSCSLCDLFVPLGIYNYRYAFTIFVTDGFFETPSEFGRYLLSFRCSFITGTYAILHSHFVYRYMALAHDYYLNYFLPYGLVFSVLYCLLHMAFWTFVAGYLSGTNVNQRLRYVQDSFMKYYGQDPMELNIVIAQYWDASPDFIRDTWIGIGLLSIVSFASLLIIVLFGFLIIAELRNQILFLSANTRRQQTQLTIALVIQTITPTVACFLPCFFSWYQPMFGINVGQWLQNTSSIVMSMFPVIDPLSTIFVLPTLRRQVKNALFRTAKTKTNSATTPSRVTRTNATCF